MKLIWMSDIHLNFLKQDQREEFYSLVSKKNGDAIIVSGDIAESYNVVPILTEMQDYLKIPVYFVLGNHDFYGASVAGVKSIVKKLNYLPKNSGTPLSDSTILLGVDGWGDCRNGDFEHSHLTMSDWLYIDELRKGYGQGMNELKKALQKLADSDARSLKRKVLKALKDNYTKIIIVTHVPPFEEACLYAGRKSTPDGLPFFSSKILGDTILPIAKKNPKVDFLWLSGHTHSRVKYKPCNNMTVKVAKSEYYYPQVEEVIHTNRERSSKAGV